MSLSPTVNSNASVALQTGFISAVAGFVRTKLFGALKILNARRELHAELVQLDHRELNDLGIGESGIDGFVAAWRPDPRA